jgi:hypothetical protein
MTGRALTKKQHAFLIAYADGHGVVASARMAKLSIRHAYRLQKDPSFRTMVRERARSIVSDAAPHAAKRLAELMSQSDSLHVAREAATTLLAIEGIKAPVAGPSVSVQVAVGYDIDLDSEREPSPALPVSAKVIDRRPPAVRPRPAAALESSPHRPCPA